MVSLVINMCYDSLEEPIISSDYTEIEMQQLTDPEPYIIAVILSIVKLHVTVSILYLLCP